AVPGEIPQAGFRVNRKLTHELPTGIAHAYLHTSRTFGDIYGAQHRAVIGKRDIGAEGQDVAADERCPVQRPGRAHRIRQLAYCALHLLDAVYGAELCELAEELRRIRGLERILILELLDDELEKVALAELIARPRLLMVASAVQMAIWIHRGHVCRS